MRACVCGGVPAGGCDASLRVGSLELAAKPRTSVDWVCVGGVQLGGVCGESRAGPKHVWTAPALGCPGVPPRVRHWAWLVRAIGRRRMNDSPHGRMQARRQRGDGRSAARPTKAGSAGHRGARGARVGRSVRMGPGPHGLGADQHLECRTGLARAHLDDPVAQCGEISVLVDTLAEQLVERGHAIQRREAVLRRRQPVNRAVVRIPRCHWRNARPGRGHCARFLAVRLYNTRKAIESAYARGLKTSLGRRGRRIPEARSCTAFVLLSICSRCALATTHAQGRPRPFTVPFAVFESSNSRTQAVWGRGAPAAPRDSDGNLQVPARQQ